MKVAITEVHIFLSKYLSCLNLRCYLQCESASLNPTQYFYLRSLMVCRSFVNTSSCYLKFKHFNLFLLKFLFVFFLKFGEMDVLSARSTKQFFQVCQKIIRKLSYCVQKMKEIIQQKYYINVIFHIGSCYLYVFFIYLHIIARAS